MRHHTVAPLRLGLVEGRIRRSHPFSDGRDARSMERCDADADGETDLAVFKVKRMPFDGCANALRESLRLLEVGMRKHNREFLTTVPPNAVDLPDGLAHESGHRFQDLIAGHMTEHVVDGLEIIQV